MLGIARGAGAVRARHLLLPAILIRLGALGDRDRRCKLPRRRAAVRRRRRRAVLRRCRAHYPAETAGRGYLRAFSKAAKMFSITAAPACAISARSSTSCSAKAISAISRSFYLLPFVVLTNVPPFPAGAMGARACSSVRRGADRHLVRHELRSVHQMVEQGALPIRRPTSCSSAPFCRLSADIGRPNDFCRRFSARFCLRSRIFMRPIVAPAAAVLLGGAGLAALYRRQWPRLAGLCIGFLPVFSMALHNGYFGHVFVLFSSNAGDRQSAGDAAVGLSRRRRANCCTSISAALVARAHPDRELAERPGGILLDHPAQCRRRRHPRLCRRARPPTSIPGCG